MSRYWCSIFKCPVIDTFTLPTISLIRKSLFVDVCIICHRKQKQALVDGKSGREKVKWAAEQRKDKVHLQLKNLVDESKLLENKYNKK